MSDCREGEGFAVRWCVTHERPMFGDATTCFAAAPPALDAAPDKKRLEAAIDNALSAMDDEWLTADLADAIAANLRAATPASGEPAAPREEKP